MISCKGLVARRSGALKSIRLASRRALSRLYFASDSAKSSSSRTTSSSSESCSASGADDAADMGGLTMRGDASAMTTSEYRRVSIGVGLGEDAVGRSADTALSLGLSDSADTLENVGDTDLACCVRCVCVATAVFSSLGTFGAGPKARSRSSLGNSRLVGTVAR